MNANVDLKQLAVRRDGPSVKEPSRRRQWWTRYVLPASILTGFVAVIAFAARDSFLPSVPVKIVPVLTEQGHFQPEGTPLFQAAGWVEPQPTAVLVTALAEGVVDQLLVVEGQEIKAGQVVARLVDADARLALEDAQANLRLKEAEAKIDEAKQRLARYDLESKKEAAPGVLPPLSLQKAQYELDSANAGVQAAEARVQQARTAVAAAKLRLDRMIVTAPISGRVLALIAQPGMRLMGLATGAHQESSTVISLYDPNMLQVRADVRLEDLPRFQPGQPVLIETAAVPGGPLKGIALFPTGKADIAKNTLPVKVSIIDPPQVLKPEMLVQVTFLAPAAAPEKTPSEKTRIMIPKNLVDLVENENRVWIADRVKNVARRKAVKLGVLSGDLVEVVEGLNVADRLITVGREGLSDGSRIRITGEETDGRSSPPSAPRKKVEGHKGKH